MPSLKDLNCSIELAASQEALQEFGTTYGDGIVETFVPVPGKKLPFSIHLTSNMFIAPGIAMYVFIDGVYQCNRNKQDLKLRKCSDSRSIVDFRVRSRSIVDFRVRQKEEKQMDGSLLARKWTFEELHTVSAKDMPVTCSQSIPDNLGCIEVVVLRCAGARNVKNASQMNLDGASDFPGPLFGIDGHPRQSNTRSMYDDRGPSISGHNTSFQPPPPVSYQAPYAETYHSYENAAPSSRRPRRGAHTSRYSEPISPCGRLPGDIPSPGFQYGSGPISVERQTSQQHETHRSTPSAHTLNPVWLSEVVTKAVKQGVEESRQYGASPEVHAAHTKPPVGCETASQLPGAWPQSPFGSDVKPCWYSEPARHTMHTPDTNDVAWSPLERGDWGTQAARTRIGTHVNWEPKPAWEAGLNADGWTSPEGSSNNSWDLDDTWVTKDRKFRMHTRNIEEEEFGVPNRVKSRATSPITIQIRHRRHRSDGRAQRNGAKSLSRHSRRHKDLDMSSEDNEGWTHVDTGSGSTASWDTSDETVQPSHSLSQLHIPRSRSAKRSTRSKPTQHHVKSRPLGHTQYGTTWQPVILNHQSPPSVMTRVTPTVMNAPTTVHTAITPLTTSQTRSDVPLAPSPTGVRGNLGDVANLPPAPYATTVNDFAHSTMKNDRGKTRSRVSPSWSRKKPESAEDNWKLTAQKEADGKYQGRNWDQSFEVTDFPAGWTAVIEDDNDIWKSSNDAKDRRASRSRIDRNGWSEDDPLTQEEKDGTKAGDAWAPNNNDISTKKADRSTWGSQGNAWSSGAVNDCSKRTQWNNDGPPTLPSAKYQHTTTAPPSKRHTSKSLTKYRQLRSNVVDPTPQPHWQFPPPPSKKKAHSAPDHTSLFVTPKEPLMKISKQVASEAGLDHQVRAGQGSQYGHAVARPEYLDRLDKPYAVFRFKYRSLSVLRSLFGHEIPDDVSLTQRTSRVKLDEAKAKEKLKGVPRDELVEKMLRLQEESATGREKRDGKGGERERRPSMAKTELVAKEWTEEWVRQQRREASEQGKGKMGTAGADKNGAGEAWDQNGGGGNWGEVKW